MKAVLYSTDRWRWCSWNKLDQSAQTVRWPVNVQIYEMAVGKNKYRMSIIDLSNLKYYEVLNMLFLFLILTFKKYWTASFHIIK